MSIPVKKRSTQWWASMPNYVGVTCHKSKPSTLLLSLLYFSSGHQCKILLLVAQHRGTKMPRISCVSISASLLQQMTRCWIYLSKFQHSTVVDSLRATQTTFLIKSSDLIESTCGIIDVRSSTTILFSYIFWDRATATLWRTYLHVQWNFTALVLLYGRSHPQWQHTNSAHWICTRHTSSVRLYIYTRTRHGGLGASPSSQPYKP